MSSLVFPTSLILIVAATSPSLGIGYAGSIPWRLKSDISYFSRVTKRLVPPPSAADSRKNAVIMGRKTWCSIPRSYRPLAGRINVVLSRDCAFDLQSTAGDTFIATSFDDALERLREREQEVGRIFVIGGAEIYRAALEYPFARSVLMTRIQTKYVVDTFFPVELMNEENGWVKMGRELLSKFVGEEVPDEMQIEDGLEFQYELWQKQMR
ncbi:dihydrofolate reductase-like domain-containing protein [Trichophaea hybrida]|nr:dihydrofolate reductase-like domain-containing protein [Trichophaea hybrida]